mgnify:CR=1 FL=1
MTILGVTTGPNLDDLCPVDDLSIHSTVDRILGELESRLVYLPLPASQRSKRVKAPELSDYDRRYRIATKRLQRLMEKEEIKPEDAVERWAAFEVRWNAKRQFEPIKEG